ncbi:uncharacterized protein C3orf22 homolog [Loxodonta africana]|uniref:uncharacterized protein C3orf22 homolog n=1 Tax=Loxodonta africana TaxID=9785 RepID=UPI000C810C94|nr:uncharacterized protein C3orf22 homolog [Loxodonta africana]
MDSWAHRKSHQSKKCRMKTQERFAKKFPYRFSWLTEPGPESLQTSEVMKINNRPREQLPLQRGLVPTRSIPDRGLGGWKQAPPIKKSRGAGRRSKDSAREGQGGTGWRTALRPHCCGQPLRAVWLSPRLQVPDYPSLPCSPPLQPWLLPQRHLWEIKLLIQRFPGQGARVLSLLGTNVDHPRSGSCQERPEASPRTS